ncbi:MAG: cobalamin B12-binding domain-containing protein [Planctomycetes bacterium]|nr:cobalamin B12-binding domain-containing protein [Planctomycetota bacterium]
MENELSSKKVVLVVPNSRWKNKRPWLMAPQYALILTAIIKKEFIFHIIDCNGLNLSEEQCKEHLQHLKPDVVLTSGMSVEYHMHVHAVVSLSKSVNPNVITVVGGVYPTVLSDVCLKDKNVDYVFLGHAEGRINNFLKLILTQNSGELEKTSGIGIGKSGKINPLTSYIVNDKELLVNPDYSHLDLTPYLINDSIDFQFCSKIPQASILTSRGCPFGCVFCASKTVSGRGILFRKASEVLDEIEFLIDRYGVKKLLILDDSFLSNRKRAIEILQSFIDRKYNLKYNFLNIAVWHLELEIDIIADFIIGLPGETWQEIRQTFQFAEEMDFDLAHFHIATPQPQTDLYRICKERNLLPQDFSFTNPKYFGFAQAFLETEEFTPFELKVLRAFEWDRINFKTPQKIAKVAQIYNTSIDHLNRHRKETRLKLGLHCDSAPVGIAD